MRNKILALAMAVVMTAGMGMTALASSSTTTSNSGVAVEQAKPGEVVSTDSVAVSTGGSTVTLTVYVETKQAEVVSTITQTATAAAVGTTSVSAGEAVSALMSAPATPMFVETINALGGKAAINNCGTKKTAAVAQDAFGNVIASAGTVKGVTSGSLVMLMSVNADGTIEFVEGVVDPVTGQILGAFKGTPKTISVLVFIPA